MCVLFITTNKNKVEEAKAVLGMDVVQVDKEYPEIQGSSEEVVLFAMDILREGEPFIVEDTSLHIEALSGFPGPFASYVQKTIGNTGVLKLMEGVHNRAAFFETCIGLSYNGKKIFKGRCYGSIALEPRGISGFGFDPVFIPEGDERTFAEMSLHEKNLMSHRAVAFRALREHLENLI
jgi:XTP/dITP diphosphohydrolase